MRRAADHIAALHASLQQNHKRSSRNAKAEGAGNRGSVRTSGDVTVGIDETANEKNRMEENEGVEDNTFGRRKNEGKGEPSSRGNGDVIETQGRNENGPLIKSPNFASTTGDDDKTSQGADGDGRGGGGSFESSVKDGMGNGLNRRPESLILSQPGEGGGGVETKETLGYTVFPSTPAKKMVDLLLSVNGVDEMTHENGNATKYIGSETTTPPRSRATLRPSSGNGSCHGGASSRSIDISPPPDDVRVSRTDNSINGAGINGNGSCGDVVDHKTTVETKREGSAIRTSKGREEGGAATEITSSGVVVSAQIQPNTAMGADDFLPLFALTLVSIYSFRCLPKFEGFDWSSGFFEEGDGAVGWVQVL